ncbi:MAG: cation-translocating P-type ATPase [Lachnospiraceae bacterium]|jgi:Ca2+-transporting ATPase|nr:cation-translocating P-type ATPase [Lachnospiraceae bacterium]MCI1334763.1 cation-translocating P-type ATPase [Lachnospiraceae bacterium]MCI1358855.1 cation-translocating P-type ATPase [Lachnospiraceae bacterium]MCI1379503.1 cation-translocating P-type ATPase [Lachnospiraceae bacterium]MCI1455803.1 cation-translocating P-type ATPase [Lachnospiraceae bacterium]
MKDAYKMDAADVVRSVGSSSDGLSGSEAQARLAKYGPNQLKAAKKESLVHRFLMQLKDPMLIILIAAACVSAVTSVIQGESLADFYIIIGVVILNAVLGVYQESKAEAAIEALQTMTAAQSKVIRDGEMTIVPSADLVPGDVVILEAGDSVPADGRLLEAASLKIEESALTGESVPAEKETEALHCPDGQSVLLGDRRNMAYMGSTAVYGRGRMLVTATGMDTEMGRIAGALSATENEETPLQKKLAALGKTLSKLVLGICVFIFIFSLVRAGNYRLETVLSTFMVAVSLAVAAIPEGLATVVTVVLSIGVTRMSKRKAVIRRLTAVETLGCTQVICTDKTGTLTQNKMTVVEHTGNAKHLAAAMALCNDAVLKEDGAEGEPTEAALVNFASSEGLKKQDLEADLPRVDEAPFDSLRKMMSTVHEIKNENSELFAKCKVSGQSAPRFVQFTKGAPDEVIRRCVSYLDEDGIHPLTDEKRREILAQNKAYADRALRVLAAAERFWDARPEKHEAAYLEQNLIFIGLTGMIDPVRPEVLPAMKLCRSAGIRTVMITGDHKDTAVAIAKELGIADGPEQALTGADLERMSDEELKAHVKNYSVYARVQPEHKVRIVRAWKANGCVTAMTGDGVNDAPSIKAADIGIGMGITGTDVTKNVADMVLADDNFATIVGAVEEGRRIYDNIRKAIQFLLASNLAEVIAVFVATLLGFTLLNPVHLLFVNLITDTFPALALGMEQAEKDSMSRPPRKSTDGIFAGGVGGDIAYQGIVIAALTVISYIIGYWMSGGSGLPQGMSGDGMTMAFLTLNMCEILHSFNMRSLRGSIFRIEGQNKVLWLSLLFSALIMVTVVEVRPVADAFRFTPVSAREYLTALVIAVFVIPVVEIVKAAERGRRNSSDEM